MPFEKVQLEKNNQKAFHDLCDACDKMREAYHALRLSQGHQPGMIQLAFKNKKFKADIVNRPNDLSYFIDFLEPINSLDDIAVGPLNMKTISNQEDKISRLYNNDIPDVILINGSDELETRTNIIEKCHLKGQPYANVSGTLFSKLAIGTTGYSAQDSARELLYQYTNYDESISISSVPIYYLDVNSRITVNDKASGIYGDYIIKSISLPLDAKSNMSISASRALERI